MPAFLLPQELHGWHYSFPGHPGLKPVILTFSFAFHVRWSLQSCQILPYLSYSFCPFICIAHPWFRLEAAGLGNSKAFLGLPTSCLNPSRWCFLGRLHYILNTWPGMEGPRLTVLLPTILLHSLLLQPNGKMGQSMFSICVSSVPPWGASLLVLLPHCVASPQPHQTETLPCVHIVLLPGAWEKSV